MGTATAARRRGTTLRARLYALAIRRTQAHIIKYFRNLSGNPGTATLAAVHNS